MKSIILLALLVTAATARAELLLAKDGQAKTIILVDPAAGAASGAGHVRS